jgi:hypothetical protein
MGPEKIDFNSLYAKREAKTDFRILVANADGGGSWKRGYLYLLMASVDGTPLTIQNMVQHIDAKRLPPPAWVYRPSGDCGDTYSRVYRLDLDNNSLFDLGLQGNGEAGNGKPPPTEPLGPAFTVTDKEPALIRVDVLSCKDNYSWTLDVTYVRNGKSETRVVGPYRSMGKAEDTELYQDDPYTGELSAGSRRFSSKADDKC